MISSAGKKLAEQKNECKTIKKQLSPQPAELHKTWTNLLSRIQQLKEKQFRALRPWNVRKAKHEC